MWKRPVVVSGWLVGFSWLSGGCSVSGGWGLVRRRRKFAQPPQKGKKGLVPGAKAPAAGPARPWRRSREAEMGAGHRVPRAPARRNGRRGARRARAFGFAILYRGRGNKKELVPAFAGARASGSKRSARLTDPRASRSAHRPRADRGAPRKGQDGARARASDSRLSLSRRGRRRRRPTPLLPRKTRTRLTTRVQGAAPGDRRRGELAAARLHRRAGLWGCVDSGAAGDCRVLVFRWAPPRLFCDPPPLSRSRSLCPPSPSLSRRASGDSHHPGRGPSRQSR